MIYYLFFTYFMQRKIYRQTLIERKRKGSKKPSNKPLQISTKLISCKRRRKMQKLRAEVTLWYFFINAHSRVKKQNDLRLGEGSKKKR